eukprot:1087497-Pyramimonas_sp.AAC.1
MQSNGIDEAPKPPVPLLAQEDPDVCVIFLYCTGPPVPITARVRRVQHPRVMSVYNALGLINLTEERRVCD